MIDKLAWILIKDGALLVVRSHNRDLYYIPGGKRETGESDHEALTREVKEELSVDLVLSSIRAMGQFQAQADGKPAGTTVQLSCYTADYQGKLLPAAEIAELAWLPYADRHRVSRVAQLVFDAAYEAGLLK
jgi:8-oxo-dGTP diphosphatase